MIMMAAAPSFGSDEDPDLHMKYREFGQTIFNDINGDTSRQFVIDIENIIAEMRSAGDSFRASERDFPVLHSCFMSLVSEQTSPFIHRVKCSILVFTAFSQIEASGCWKNVAYVKSVPARLMYLFRSIILYELLLKNDGLVFDDVDNNVQVGTAINDDGLDTDLTEEELEEFHNNA
ncbi:uncharacterized protein ATC70_011871 [Mucor velutinosus]|uniref:Uncharacterized protein n=1 Tax=Mucor velutinosus TaxID=708070 RepID=A0AAN7D9L3_9FUNG|nr:hypothetical protein ATC70_011871 [Mucor velutinosus]